MSLLQLIEQNLLQLEGTTVQDKDALQQLIYAYILLIEKWNKVHNLTAIRKPEDMLYQHMMDSLAVLPYIQGPNIVDVGTGAGLPGIPIAMARPDWQITLIESNKKKTSFLQQAKIELSLSNIAIFSKRIEDWRPEKGVNTIISRAFSSLGEFVHLSRHLNTGDNGDCTWVAMKSNCTDLELAQITKPYYIENVITINVPGLAAKRQLVVIKQEAC